MKRKLLSALVMILLLGTSKVVFAERAVPAHPEIKLEYVENTQADFERKDNSITLLSDTSKAKAGAGYGRSAIEKRGNGAELVKIYDTIVSGIRNFDTTIIIDINFDLKVSEAEAFVKVIMGSITQAIINDNPELFWFGIYGSQHYLYDETVGCIYNAENKVTSLTLAPKYNTEKDKALSMQTQMETAADEFIKQANITKSMTDYDKALALHDVVCANLVYDNSQSLEWIHTAYGAFVNKLAVCDGYSKAYQYLLNKVGIDSHIATGSSKGESHAWNLVKLDGEWYYTDVTWDDSEYGIFYEYFNITTELLNEDHELDSSAYKMPDCTATDNWYMKKENIYQTQSSRIDTGKITELIKVNPHATVYFTDGEMTETVEKTISNWFNENANNIAGKIVKCGQEFNSATCFGLKREYHFVWVNNEKNYIYTNGSDRNKVYINLLDNGSGVLIQSFYNEKGILTRTRSLPIMFNQYDVFKLDMTPDDGFDDYKYIKYMLWRSGTMRPVCDMKTAS